MKGTEQEDSMTNLLRGRFRKCIDCINIDYQTLKEETFYNHQMDHLKFHSISSKNVKN